VGENRAGGAARGSCRVYGNNFLSGIFLMGSETLTGVSPDYSPV